MILALDPGVRGAICWTFQSNFENGSTGLLSLKEHDPMQLFDSLAWMVRSVPDTEKRVAFIEANTGFLAGLPRTGASMYTFGLATGRAEMALIALGFSIQRVRPRDWQKGIGAPKRRKEESSHRWKGRLATFARELYPELTSRITRENADALLILRYALLTLDKLPK